MLTGISGPHPGHSPGMSLPFLGKVLDFLVQGVGVDVASFETVYYIQLHSRRLQLNTLTVWDKRLCPQITLCL